MPRRRRSRRGELVEPGKLRDLTGRELTARFLVACGWKRNEFYCWPHGDSPQECGVWFRTDCVDGVDFATKGEDYVGPCLVLASRAIKDRSVGVRHDPKREKLRWTGYVGGLARFDDDRPIRALMMAVVMAKEWSKCA